MIEEGQLGGKVNGKCELCKDGVAKYRCPGCDIQTCSFICVRDHKNNTGCTGKRARASQSFIPSSKLTPEILFDDCQLLEEINQSNELLARVLPKSKPRNQSLVKHCAARNTCLSLMPAGMKRARQNKTFFSDDIITWTVEWILLSELNEHPATMKLHELQPFISKTVYSQCQETESLSQSYSNLFKETADPTDILLLKQEADKDTSISPVDISATRRLWQIHSNELSWKLLLANRTVIEFPTIYIYKKHGT